MANRDPEPESRHQQFSDEYLIKNKGVIPVLPTAKPATVASGASVVGKPLVKTGPERYREFAAKQKTQKTSSSSSSSFSSKKKKK
jgi:hypothetical protein